MHIRAFDPDRDQAFLRRCVIELQELERQCDTRLPAGITMVEAYCEALLERSRNWRGEFLVAEDAGRPVGLLTMFLGVLATEPDEPAAPYALISDLVVLPDARGLGIGSALLRRAEACAAAAGVDVLRLEVLAGNRAARDFYDQAGWRERLVQMEKVPSHP